MKKNIVKIFTSASIVVAIILIMVLLVTAFGGIDAEEFDSKLVQGLICTLGILYIVLAIISLVLIFLNTDILKEVTLRTDRGGSIRVSAQVITKYTKTACKTVEGVKCTKVTILEDTYGTRLKADVRIKDKDVIQTEAYLRALLEDLFMGEFGFRFNSIEFKVTSLVPKYVANTEAVAEKAAASVEKINEMNAAAQAEEEAKIEATIEAPATEEPVEETKVEATEPAEAQLVEILPAEIEQEAKEETAEEQKEEKTEE